MVRAHHTLHVLEVYSRPYHPDYPVLCMDEQPIQLTKETRQAIPATKRHPRRVDYEYERALYWLQLAMKRLHNMLR